MRKLKFREVKKLAPNHTAGKWQKWDRISGVLPHSPFASFGLFGAGRKKNLKLYPILPLWSPQTTWTQIIGSKKVPRTQGGEFCAMAT